MHAYARKPIYDPASRYQMVRVATLKNTCAALMAGEMKCVKTRGFTNWKLAFVMSKFDSQISKASTTIQWMRGKLKVQAKKSVGEIVVVCLK